MAAKKRRRRTPSGGYVDDPRPAIVDRRGRPLAVWNWRTFPVLFSLSTGLLIGYFLGLFLSGGSPTLHRPGLVAYIVILGLFSFSLSRLSGRLLGYRILQRRRRQSERE
ncbi:MAG: hypothetical protein ACR2PL_01775 [Dehalococcoidia bacterium]